MLCMMYWHLEIVQNSKKVVIAWFNSCLELILFNIDQLSIACKSSWADFNYNGLGYNLNHSLWCRQLAINFHNNLKYLNIRFGKRFWGSKGRPWFPNFPMVQNTLLNYEILHAELFRKLCSAELMFGLYEPWLKILHRMADEVGGPGGFLHQI